MWFSTSIIMSLIENLDSVAVIFIIGAIFGCVSKRFLENIKDGFQTKDVSASINEGFQDYQKAAMSVESIINQSKGVIEDITINDADTVAAVKKNLEFAISTLASLKKYK